MKGSRASRVALWATIASCAPTPVRTTAPESPTQAPSATASAAQKPTECATPVPLPEVVDGVDNDCNGVIDDIPPARVAPRALVFGPAYVWTDARSDLASVSTLLEQAGVPYDVQPANTDWKEQLGGFGRYSLIVIPGYLESAALGDAVREALEAFASGGGVVFVMKPIGSTRGSAALELAGITAAQRASTATALRITGRAPAVAAFDAPEEREMPLTLDPQHAPMDVWTYEPAKGTEIVAQAFAGEQPLGAAATRRPLGHGAIYAWGHNVATFDASRCYTNCFEPSGDLLRLFLRDALREGALGHVILKHPIPAGADSMLVLTHDVDSEDAYVSGAWGEPGALQMAAMERRHHVAATYNFATGSAKGTFHPEIVERLCKDGFCPSGAGSVRSLRSFGRHPRGTCRETLVTYGPHTPATLCGEVRVSVETLADIAHQRPRAWRSPNLSDNPLLFDVLADTGVLFDSSFAIGDLKYNLPVDAALSPKLQHRFHHRPLFEFPLVLEDGRRSGDERIELQSSNIEWFETVWRKVLLANAANSSITTLAVRPTRGHGAADDNIGVKVAAVEHLIETAEAHGIAVGSLVHFGDFWRARSKVAMDATYDAVTGYQGSLDIGNEPIEGLTLEMGDVIASFECTACGAIEIHGKRVVLRDKLGARTHATFTAHPGLKPETPANGSAAPRGGSGGTDSR